ncbi:MAG TPA: hypothetical protein VNA69_07935 [Thermoanaerobaculia bacterium]|nr:hypothetical protein [Thermoanaerobaculia bacterium]
MSRMSAACMSVIAVLSMARVSRGEELTRLSVHGYLSQAYARSDGHQILGIGEDGTSDYRDLALQFRYQQSPRNVLIVQFSHERLGDSPVAKLKDDVEIDWAFYQRELTEKFSLKVGRIPIPLGIYNESRDAGTTFPFYRPATGVYGEGQYSNETVEGAVLSASIPAFGSWSFDADLYYGEWDFVQEDFETRADVDDAVGGQLWINTPIVGLRFGAGHYRADVSNLLFRPPGTVAVYSGTHASIEADFDRWSVAAEALEVDGDIGAYRSAYVQAGAQVHPRWSIHARVEQSRLYLAAGRVVVNRQIDRDYALAVNYAVAPAVVVKVEGHSNSGLLVEDVPVTITDPPYRTRYAILSLAASF